MEKKGKQNGHKHNEEFLQAFGAHVRKLRETKGFSLRKFANEADVEYSTMSNIELGKTNTTLSTAIAIADALGITHQELFDFKLLNKRSK